MVWNWCSKPRRAIVRVGAFLCFIIALHGNADAEGRSVLAFAQAVSGGDKAVMAQAEALIATPPTTLEGIGFYGKSKASAEERSLRGIVTLLLANGYLMDFEDKYINEMVYTLAGKGILPRIEGTHGLGLFEMDENDPKAFAVKLRAGFAGHLRAIEQGAAAKGYALLSVNFGAVGDGMIVWAARPEVAQDWRGKVLFVGPNATRSGPKDAPVTVIAVTAPDWQRYWAFLTYAFMLPQDFWPYPIAD